jgi:hypothetical protein
MWLPLPPPPPPLFKEDYSIRTISEVDLLGHRKNKENGPFLGGREQGEG